jgi:hypothetical protein
MEETSVNPEFGDWGLEEKELSLGEMDALIKEMRTAKEAYEEKKKESTGLYKEFSALESKVMQALEAAGKKKYSVEGLGTFSIVHKQVVKVCKTIEEKKKLFEWVKNKYGDDFLTSLITVNHATLNSFYNKEYDDFLCRKEQAVQDGVDMQGVVFDIPLEEPTIQKSTSFRKSK